MPPVAAWQARHSASSAPGRASARPRPPPPRPAARRAAARRAWLPAAQRVQRGQRLLDPAGHDQRRPGCPRARLRDVGEHAQRRRVGPVRVVDEHASGRSAARFAVSQYSAWRAANGSSGGAAGTPVELDAEQRRGEARRAREQASGRRPAAQHLVEQLADDAEGERALELGAAGREHEQPGVLGVRRAPPPSARSCRRRPEPSITTSPEPWALRASASSKRRELALRARAAGRMSSDACRAMANAPPEPLGSAGRKPYRCQRPRVEDIPASLPILPKEFPHDPGPGPDPQRRRQRADVRHARRDQGRTPRSAIFQFRAHQPLDRRRTQPLHDPGLLRRRPGGQHPRARRSPSTPASRPCCSASTPAPNPAEHLLHALAACLTTTLVYVATARKIRLTEVESTLEGDMDVRGCLGLDDDVRNGFTRHPRELQGQGRRARRRSCARSSSAPRPAPPSSTWSTTACRSRSDVVDRLSDARAHRQDRGRRPPGRPRRDARRGAARRARRSTTARRRSRTPASTRSSAPATSPRRSPSSTAGSA